MSTPLPLSNRLPYLLIALVWLVTRAYPLWTTEPWIYWEIGEARKLLEYGFWTRAGAIIDIHFMNGIVAEPWKFNYVNHPYPILWFDTLVHWFAGGWGVVLANALARLAACLLVFLALKWVFSPGLALVGAVLFTLAPSDILFTFDPNTVQLGAILWPPAIYLIGKNLQNRQTVGAVALGAVVFFCGQIDWFTYSILPALLCAACGFAYDRSSGFTTKPNTGLIAGILAGSVLTMAAFACQIVCYTHNFSDTLVYVQGQASSEQGVPLRRMYAAIAMRGILSAGPALFLGSLAGIICLARKRTVNWLQWTAILYPLLFVGAAIVLPRFFFRERTMYQYLLFPCTVLTLTALQHLGSRLATGGIIALAVLGLVYPAFQFSIPVVSKTSRKLGSLLREISQPDEVVATNLVGQQKPFQNWDVGSIGMASLSADRMIRAKILTKEELQSLLKNYRAKELKVVFLYDTSRPIDPALITFLRSVSLPVITRFDVPHEPASVATQVRSIYWKMAGKHHVTGQTGQMGEANIAEQFEIYRFTLSEPSSGDHSP